VWRTVGIDHSHCSPDQHCVCGQFGATFASSKGGSNKPLTRAVFCQVFGGTALDLAWETPAGICCPIEKVNEATTVHVEQTE